MALEDMSVSAAAVATMVFDVRSTQVTIHVLPFFEAGNGPIKSMAQLVKGCNGMAEKIQRPYEVGLSFSRLRKHCKTVRSVRRLQAGQASSTHRTLLHKCDQFRGDRSRCCHRVQHTGQPPDSLLARRFLP